MDISTDIVQACGRVGQMSRSSKDTLATLKLIEDTLRTYGPHPVTFDDVAALISLIRVAAGHKPPARAPTRLKV